MPTVIAIRQNVAVQTIFYNLPLDMLHLGTSTRTWNKKMFISQSRSGAIEEAWVGSRFCVCGCGTSICPTSFTNVHFWTKMDNLGWNNRLWWMFFRARCWEIFFIVYTLVFFCNAVEPFFLLLIGCPMANFGPFTKGQPHSPDVNHCVLHFWPEGHQEPCNEVGSISLTKHWTTNLPILTTMA